MFTILAANQFIDSVKQNAFHDLAFSRLNTSTTYQLFSTDSWTLLLFESIDQAHSIRTEANFDLTESAAIIAKDNCCSQTDIQSSEHPNYIQYISQIINRLNLLTYNINSLIDYITKKNYISSDSFNILSNRSINISLKSGDIQTDSLDINTEYFDNQYNTLLFASGLALYL